MFNFDNVYRWLLQDIVSEIMVENLRKDPRKEVNRVIDLFCARWRGDEKENNFHKKFRKVGKAINLLLLRKKYRNLFIEFISSLNLNKLDFSKIDWESAPLQALTPQIAMDEGDWYEVLGFAQYDFGGISLHQRMETQRQINRRFITSQIKNGIIKADEILGL